MALNKQTKTRIISKHRRHKEDTGSPEVQVAILTKKINSLTDHLKVNRKDFGSRRGLLKMVSKRRKMLNYLKREDEKKYKAVIKELKLKEVAA